MKKIFDDSDKKMIEESVKKFGPELAGICLSAVIDFRSHIQFKEDFIKEIFSKSGLLEDVCYWIKK